MILFYVGAGINHFVHESFYEAIMPPYMGCHHLLINLSGLAEIFFGVLLIFKQSRRIGAALIIILLIAIFPANIQMTINYFQNNNPNLWISIVRLPIQILLIGWAFLFTRKN